MKRHFVQFFSPGTFMAEQTDLSIDTWDVNQAMKMAHGIKERYDATPFGFKFITRERADDELDSKLVSKSGMYFLGGTILTLEEVKARNDPNDKILISNMEINEWDRIIENRNSWRSTQVFEKDSTLLEFVP